MPCLVENRHTSASIPSSSPSRNDNVDKRLLERPTKSRGSISTPKNSIPLSFFALPPKPYTSMAYLILVDDDDDDDDPLGSPPPAAAAAADGDEESSVKPKPRGSSSSSWSSSMAQISRYRRSSACGCRSNQREERVSQPIHTDRSMIDPAGRAQQRSSRG